MKMSLQILLFSLLLFGKVIHAQCDVSENFDTYEINDVPDGWTVINTTGETSNIYAKVQPSNQAPTPPRFLRMYNGNATTGNLIFVAPQVAETSDGNHRVKFWLQGTSTSQLELGTIDTNDEMGTFSLITTFSLTNEWEYYEANIPAGTNEFLAFRHNLADVFDQINFDSICLEEIPTCLEVSNVTLSNPTTTTLDLNWNESPTGEDNWEYVVQEVGTGVPDGNGEAFTSTDVNPTVTVSNLVMNTEYEAYVRSDCGDGDYGAWIFTDTALRTSCGLITENFCEDWEGIPDNSVPFCWNVIDDPVRSGHVYVDYEFSYSKNMLELFFTSNTQMDDIIAISPDVTYAMDGAHRLKFKAGGSVDVPDLLEVGTINASGDFELLTTCTPTADREQEYLVDLPNNDHTSFAFRHNGAVNKYIWINEVCVEDIPSCLEVTDVTASNVEFDSATISWSVSGSNETTWEYLVQESMLPTPDASAIGTETMQSSIDISLAENTAYKAYVRAKCSTEDLGAWIASEEFTTACASFTANYNDGFEGVNVSGEEVKPCWSIVDTTNGDLKTFSTTFGISPSQGDLMVRMFVPSSADPEGLFLISPEFSDLTVDKQLRFKMNKRTGNEAEFDIIVGTVADPNDMSTFTVLDDTALNEATVIADTWTEYTIDLSAYDTNLNHNYIVFKPQHSGTGSSLYLFMDEFSYEYSTPEGFNDEAVTASVLTASEDYTCNNAITGDFVGATRSEEFPCTTTIFSDYNDLWYRFTPTESGEFAFGLDALNGDSMSMYLFEGSSSNPIPLSVGCSSRFAVESLVEGETYFIAVASPEPSAQYSLCVYKYPEVPVNDEIENAVVLEESEDRECNNLIEGYTGSATFSDDSACSSQTVDVWYTFTPAETGEYTFRRRFVNGSGVTGVSVYSGTPGNLTSLTECGEQRVLADLVQGEQYYVAVSTSPLSQPVYFTLCAYKSPPPPANDSCETPTALTVGTTFEDNVIVGRNTSATVDPSNSNFPTCGTLEFSTYGRDVWFEVVVPESGTFTIETRFEDDSLLSDTVIETYTGSCGTDTLEPFTYILPSGNPAQCSDQYVIGGNDQFAGMKFTDKEPGQTVLVRVWGWARQFGDFQISAYDDAPECNYPTNLSVSDITENSALLTFSEASPTPVDGYEFILQPAQTGYPGDALGTNVINTQVFLGDLTPETEYEVYVKSICSENGSAWEGPIYFTTEASLGMNDFALSNFNFYPNPVKERLTFSNSELIEAITIYSLTGKKVGRYVVNHTEGQINLSNLSSGLYMMEVETALGKNAVKLVVE